MTAAFVRKNVCAGVSSNKSCKRVKTNVLCAEVFLWPAMYIFATTSLVSTLHFLHEPK